MSGSLALAKDPPWSPCAGLVAQARPAPAVCLLHLVAVSRRRSSRQLWPRWTCRHGVGGGGGRSTGGFCFLPGCEVRGALGPGPCSGEGVRQGAHRPRIACDTCLALSRAPHAHIAGLVHLAPAGQGKALSCHTSQLVAALLGPWAEGSPSKLSAQYSRRCVSSSWPRRRRPGRPAHGARGRLASRLSSCLHVPEPGQRPGFRDAGRLRELMSGGVQVCGPCRPLGLRSRPMGVHC